MSESKHEACLDQKGMSNSSPSAVEPKPSGKSVNSEATRSSVGGQPPTIGPRNA